MVDLTYLEQFTRGDQQKMKRYISLYLDVASTAFAEMERDLKTKNWEQLRIRAHSLKPQVDYMGITNLKEELIKIELAVQTNQLDALDSLVTQTLKIARDSAILLQQLLEKI